MTSWVSMRVEFDLGTLTHIVFMLLEQLQQARNGLARGSSSASATGGVA